MAVHPRTSPNSTSFTSPAMKTSPFGSVAAGKSGVRIMAIAAARPTRTGFGSPLLLISGAGPTTTAGQGHFQDLDQVGLARPIAKFSASIDDAERTLHLLAQAFATATAEPCGPVHLMFPLDVQKTEIGGSDAFHAKQLNGVREEAGTLHAHADDAEAHAVARRDGARRKWNLFWIQDHRARGYVRAGGAGAALEEFTAGKILFHFALLEEIDSRNLKVGSPTANWNQLSDSSEQNQGRVTRNQQLKTRDYFSDWTLTSLKKTMSLSL